MTANFVFHDTGISLPRICWYDHECQRTRHPSICSLVSVSSGPVPGCCSLLIRLVEGDFLHLSPPVASTKFITSWRKQEASQGCFFIDTSQNVLTTMKHLWKGVNQSWTLALDTSGGCLCTILASSKTLRQQRERSNANTIATRLPCGLTRQSLGQCVNLPKKLTSFLVLVYSCTSQDSRALLSDSMCKFRGDWWLLSFRVNQPRAVL